MQGPEKNSYKEFDNEKKFLQLENSPPPPITFLMVRPVCDGLSRFIHLTATMWRRPAGTNFAFGSYIPANSHGFPGSLQIFHQISCSPGYSTKSSKSKQGETQKS